MLQVLILNFAFGPAGPFEKRVLLCTIVRGKKAILSFAQTLTISPEFFEFMKNFDEI